MKTRHFFPIIIAFILAGCNSTPKNSVADGELTTVDFNEIKKTETLPLSMFVENLKLIQFEDIDKALFKPWYTTATDKYIGVRQERAPYKLFDHTGKFLCDIGRVGQGPGEYSITLYDDLIDDKNELVYLASMTGNKIFVYKTTGEYVKSIEAPINLNKPKLHLSDNGILSVVHMPFGSNEPVVLQFDADGKAIKELTPSDFLVVSNFDGEIFNTRNTSAFDFLHTNSDTLYHYNVAKNRIEPVFTISVDAKEKPFRQYMELPNHYFTYIFGKGLVCTDKETNNSSYIKVVNDELGNMDMPTYIMHLRNGRYVYNLEPGQLIDKIEKRLSESDCTENDKKKLNELLAKLDDNSNNWLFLGKLK